jgi:hypothetical protein
MNIDQIIYNKKDASDKNRSGISKKYQQLKNWLFQGSLEDKQLKL